MDDEPEVDDPNVVEIGDLRLRRQTKYQREIARTCLHKHLTMEEHGEIVRCDDCGQTVTAYWALSHLAAGYQRARQRLQARSEQVTWEAKKHVNTKAARAIEDAWRRKMAPTCPHCGAGILPEDGFGGSSICRELALAQRKASEVG